MLCIFEQLYNHPTMDSKEYKKDGTLKRNKMLFVNYIKIIQSLGDNAVHTSKFRLYELACQPFPNINSWTAGRIIQQLYKDSKNSDLEYLLSEQKASEILGVLKQLHESSK